MTNEDTMPLNKEFEDCIKESYLLLSYALQKGFIADEKLLPQTPTTSIDTSKSLFPYDEKLILTITDFKNYFTSTEEQKENYKKRESEFWNAYSKISKIVDSSTKNEVTIESIKNSIDFYRKIHLSFNKKMKLLFTFKFAEISKNYSYSLIDSMLFRYRTITYFLILLFILIQIYWYLGQGFQSEYKELSQQISTNNQNVSKLIDNVNLKIALEDTSKKKSIDKYYDSAFLELQKQIRKTTSGLISNAINFFKWNQVWRCIIPITDYSITKEKLDIRKESIYSAFKNLDSMIINQKDLQKFSSFDNNVTWLENMNQIQSNNAFFVLNVIQTYLIPLIAALLGTLAYVLRSISYKIKSDSFSKVSRSDYKLRMTLGALAGVSVGWISTNGSINFSYSPLIIAFAVGYNIEAIFKMVDEILFKYLSKSNDKKN